jgi:hypothetical protein
MPFEALDKMIHSAVLDLLKEQQEKPEEKPEDKPEKKADEKPAPKKQGSKVGRPSFGSGRFKGFIEAIEKRKNSPQLLKDLGVTSASGATDLDKAANVLRQAIRNNPIMAQAYENPSLATSGEKKLLRVPVKTEAKQELNPRNANKFVYLTLAAAEETGLLNMENGIDFVSVTETDTPTIFGR